MITSPSRKRAFLLILALILIFSTSGAALGAISLPIRIVINGDKFIFDTNQPIQDAAGCIFAPVDFTASAFGAEITSDSGTGKAKITIDGNSAEFSPDSREYTFNGGAKSLNNACFLSNSVLYAPVMELCTIFGISNKYDSAVNTIYISDQAAIKTYVYKKGAFDCFVNLKNGNLPGQLKALRKELQGRLAPDTVEAVMAHASLKKTEEYYLPVKFLLDGKTGLCVRVVGENEYIKVYCYDTEYSAVYNKTVDPGNSLKIAGYDVPKKTDLKIASETSNGNTTACFKVNVTLKSYKTQLQELASILKQKHDLTAIVDLVNDLYAKTSDFDILVNHWFYDDRTKNFLWVKESKRGDPYVSVYVCTEKWSKQLRGNTKEPYIEIISGFIIPQGMDLIATPYSWGGTADLDISVNVLARDFPGQISDLSAILLQKCDKATVDQVAKYVGQKKSRSTYLADKHFYDKKTKRYIYVKESRMDDVTILFCSESYSKAVKK
jgi:hypothetical protein